MEALTQSRLIARLAPVLRSRFRKNSFSVCAFRPGTVQNPGAFSLLQLSAGDADSLEAQAAAFEGRPDLIQVEGLGVFAIGRCKADAEAILDSALEGCAYSAPNPAHFEEGRMQGRVIFITGAAQGFGEGLAKVLARNGAHIMVTDIQMEKARAVAEALCTQYGPGTAAAAMVTRKGAGDSRKQSPAMSGSPSR